MNFKAVIEGLLFVSGEEGLNIDEICNIIEKDKNYTNKLIKELYEDYENNDRGLHLEFLGNKYKLTTKAEHKNFYKKMIKEEENSPFSFIVIFLKLLSCSIIISCFLDIDRIAKKVTMT